MKKKHIITSVSLAAALLMSSCGGTGRNTPSADSGQSTTAAASTTASTTALNELDNETDWSGMADIEEVSVENEAGTGSLYVSGQKAGEVKALCYYDLAGNQPELAELLAQRYGGTKG